MHRHAGGTLGLLPDPACGLLVGRGGAHRRRGDLATACPRSGGPSRKNAATTLGGHGGHPRHVLLRHLGAGPPARSPTRADDETMLVDHGPRRVRRRQPIYFVLQVATVAILILAANTAYADFPRLSSIIARDGYLPRQLANRGDRLVFSNGDRRPGRAPPPACSSAFGGHHHRPDPAVRRRRVHRLHAVADGHGPPPPARSEAGLAARRRSSTASARVATVHRAGRRRGLEVHHRRLDPGRRDPARSSCCSGRSTGTTSGSGSGWRCRRAGKPRRHEPHRGRAGRAGSTRACSRRSPTPVAAPDHLVAVTVVSDEEEQEQIEQAVGDLRHRRCRSRSSTRPYRELSRPILRFIDELDARWRQRHRHRASSPSSWSPLVGAAAPQPDAPCSSRAGCCSARAWW